MANLTYVRGGGLMEVPEPYGDPHEEAVWLLVRLDVTYGAMRFGQLRKIVLLCRRAKFTREDLAEIGPVARATANRLERQAVAYQKFQEQGVW